MPGGLGPTTHWTLEKEVILWTTTTVERFCGGGVLVDSSNAQWWHNRKDSERGNPTPPTQTVKGPGPAGIGAHFSTGTLDPRSLWCRAPQREWWQRKATFGQSCQIATTIPNDASQPVLKCNDYAKFSLNSFSCCTLPSKKSVAPASSFIDARRLVTSWPFC